MKITLEIPSITCARCSAEAPVRPQILYPLASTEPAYRMVMQEINKAPAEVEIQAQDDAGQTWRALMTERPFGWTALPTGEKGVLCTTCAAGWAEAAKTYMIPLPPPPVVEATAEVSSDAPAPPAITGSSPSPFQKPAGAIVSGPQRIMHGSPSSPTKISVKR